MSERDLLYRVLFDMKKDIAELRAQVNNISSGRPVEQNYVQSNPVTQIGDTVVTRVNQTEHEEPRPGVCRVRPRRRDALCSSWHND